ncbi:MAG: LysR substrate-binding domain-containing protein [Casimicrobiaceae bacterium]|nr:LysR substrate-binding domain-containing protein [Casimicrobiaceae bacterium]
MELKWVEDFLQLAETGSFSRAAELRFVTQPAFSRRIRALEQWLGAELIDRTSYPTRLTKAGEQFRERAVEIVRQAMDARAIARGLQSPPSDTILFAAPHTLSLTFFPGWLSALERELGRIKVKLYALNVHDAVMSLVEGHCDLLLCYHHPNQPVQLDPTRYEVIVLGSETIAPFAKADGDGRPLHLLPGSEHRKIPYLSYTPAAYLGRMVELILQQSPLRAHLDCVYETDMSEALKVMALEGHGLAWLPESAVYREVKAKRLARCGDALWTGTMEIRLYRERGARREVVERVWKAAAAGR